MKPRNKPTKAKREAPAFMTMREAKAYIIRRNPPALMTMREAAAYLCCSERKLRYDTKARLVPHLKLRGKLIYRRESLDQALAKMEIPASP